MTATASRCANLSRRRDRAHLIETGDLVPNALLRDRFLHLQARDPEFTIEAVCDRLVDQGFTTYARARVDNRRRVPVMQVRPDTSRLRRNLGLRPQQHGAITTHIPYDLAVGLCRALDLDPVDVDL